MVKAYTSKDIDFSGDNTFSDDVDVNSEKVTSVDTPVADEDGANKKYVDDMPNTGITALELDEITEEDAKVAEVFDDWDVTVSAGESVLLMATMQGKYVENGQGYLVWFERSGSILNKNGSVGAFSKPSADDTADMSGGMYYYDASPPTGTITYKLVGYNNTGSKVACTMTAIVFKATG